MSYRAPSRYFHGAVLTPFVCAWLENRLPQLADLRVEARGMNREIYETLESIHYGAIEWRTTYANGSEPRKRTEAESQSTRERHVTTAVAAQRLGITEHGVRLAIREGRLKAEKATGTHQWVIDAPNLELFIRTRRGE